MRDDGTRLGFPRLPGHGVTMDADEQLHPEMSTAALVLHHPQARCFRV